MNPSRKVLVRYWGSHFKSRRHAEKYEIFFGALVEEGWSCHLVMERKPDESGWLGGLTRLGVGLHYLPRPVGSFDRRNIAGVRKICRSVSASVFHCDNLHMSPLIGAVLAGVPSRVWCKRAMNADFEHCRRRTPKERIALTTRLSGFLSSRIIAVSGAVADELGGLGVARSKIRVLNNPRPEGRHPAEERDGLRARLSLPLDAVVYVAVGRVEKVKGWDVLLRAFLRLVRSTRAYLVLVGPTDLPGQEQFGREVRKLMEDPGLQQRVRLVGYSADIASFLAASDVFVLPSRSEGCCNALLEALGAGLPCIATRVGNAEDVLQDEVNGFLVPRCDPASLAEAMERVLDDKVRTAMAELARLPETSFDRLGHAKQVGKLYETMLAETSPGRTPRAGGADVRSTKTMMTHE